MSKKKKPARPRPRTSYERALEDAQARLEKAIDERTAALMKIDALNREIPYLEGIVIALTPPPVEEKERAASVARPAVPYDPAPKAPETMGQEDYLAKFLPRPGRITTASPPQTPPPHVEDNPDPDEFLRDDGGIEVLS